MSEKKLHQLHAFVKGRVQGVGFRFFTMTTAQEYGLTGWVRNLYDGRVEVVAEGEHENLNSLLTELRKGPRTAVVEDVTYNFSEATGQFDRFFARQTV